MLSSPSSLLPTDSLLFCLPRSTWGFTAGAKSNCAYNVKDCCQYPYIMHTYGTHGYVKYTCSHEIYMTMVCIQSPWLWQGWLETPQPRIHISPTEPRWYYLWLYSSISPIFRQQYYQWLYMKYKYQNRVSENLFIEFIFYFIGLLLI